MSIFDVVNFDPSDVKAVMAGKGTSRGQILAVLTSQTCGEPCWHAKEEICRCSCGGKNHGCLNDGREQPQRHSKINGRSYKLEGVGPRNDLYESAARINKAAGYRYVEKPSLIIDGTVSNWTAEEIAAAKARGAEMWYSQYYGVWQETDSGAPARLKYPNASQKQWREVKAFDGQRDVVLLWVRLEMPSRPQILKVDRDGNPLPNQNPE